MYYDQTRYIHDIEDDNVELYYLAAILVAIPSTTARTLTSLDPCYALTNQGPVPGRPVTGPNPRSQSEGGNWYKSSRSRSERISDATSARFEECPVYNNGLCRLILLLQNRKVFSMTSLTWI